MKEAGRYSLGLFEDTVLMLSSRDASKQEKWLLAHTQTRYHFTENH
jgi:hypothetical protein